MTTGIIIQARTGSTRLPGKILLPLADMPMLWHVIVRCKKSKLVDKVIVATSTDAGDNPIEELCKQHGIDYFRGDLDDVLNRFKQCADTFNLDTIVRVTSDCPLVDPDIIDQSISMFNAHNDIDYVSNVLDRTFPRGLDCEVFSRPALDEAHTKAMKQQEREHVTPWIVANKKTLVFVVAPAYHGAFRLTVDDTPDYLLMQKMYSIFYKQGEIIDTKTVIEYLNSHPELLENQSVTQKHSIN